MEGFGEIFGFAIDDVEGFAVGFIPGVVFGEERVAADAGASDVPVDDLAEASFGSVSDPFGKGVYRNAEHAFDPANWLAEFDFEDVDSFEGGIDADG